MDLNIVLVKAQKELQENRFSNEEIVSYLRAAGCTKPQSIFVLAKLLECGVSEAKQIVHFSQTWAERKASDDKFSEKILTDLAKEEEK